MSEMDSPDSSSLAVRLIALVLGAALVAACAPPLPPPSVTDAPSPSAVDEPTGPLSTVIVRQGVLAGATVYIEGAFAFVEIHSSDGSVIASAENESYSTAEELLRAGVPAGDYRLVTFVRPCSGSCPPFDAPTDRCDLGFSTRAAQVLTLTIRRVVGGPCSVEVG